MKRYLFMLLIPLVLLSGCTGNTLIGSPAGNKFVITDRLTGETYLTSAYSSGDGTITFVQNGVTILIRDNYKITEAH